jgi:hypothetical protein
VRAARLFAVTLISVGVLAYSSWLLEFVLSTGLSPVDAPVWRLTLDGRPYRDVFRVAQLVAGVAFLLSGPPLVRLAPVHWTARLTAASVALLGPVVVAEAVFPGNRGVLLVTNLLFVIGSTSLVLWWPPGWRAFAAAGLALILLTWLGMVVLDSSGVDHFAGVLSRIQMVVRVVLLASGACYVIRAPGNMSVSPHARSATEAPG